MPAPRSAASIWALVTSLVAEHSPQPARLAQSHGGAALRLALLLAALALLSVTDGRVLAAEALSASSGDMSADEFLDAAFDGAVPAPKSLWLTGELKTAATEILQHPPAQLRTRYWREDQRTAWILDEIGKTEPITIGVVIDAGQISEIRVLVFRESRGWEVRYPFFLQQFAGARLAAGQQLDRDIDGISGATLSVNALTKVGRLALLFDRRLRQ